jgi:hypothetical protein
MGGSLVFNLDERRAEIRLLSLLLKCWRVFSHMSSILPTLPLLPRRISYSPRRAGKKGNSAINQALTAKMG